MTTVEVLRKARALVKKGWCRGDFARDSRGRMTGVFSDSACKFCSWGAIKRASNEHDGYEGAMATLTREVGPLVLWNDSKGRKKAEVLAAFDRAIKAAKS